MKITMQNVQHHANEHVCLNISTVTDQAWVHYEVFLQVRLVTCKSKGKKLHATLALTFLHYKGQISKDEDFATSTNANAKTVSEF